MLASACASYLNKLQSDSLQNNDAETTQPSYPPKEERKPKKAFKQMTAAEAYKYMGLSELDLERDMRGR